MKVIFLDFDGVLNDKYVDIRAQWQGHEWGYDWIRPRLVSKLNRIIRETGAKVVISSTWRQSFSILEIRDILEDSGFMGEVIDYTPDLLQRHAPGGWNGSGIPTYDRSDEILTWVKQQNEGIKFVCLGLEDGLAENNAGMNLVLTDGAVGLTDENVEEAIAILGVDTESVGD